MKLKSQQCRFVLCGQNFKLKSWRNRHAVFECYNGDCGRTLQLQFHIEQRETKQRTQNYKYVFKTRIFVRFRSLGMGQDVKGVKVSLMLSYCMFGLVAGSHIRKPCMFSIINVFFSCLNKLVLIQHKQSLNAGWFTLFPADTWQRLRSHSWATFALMEVTAEALSAASRRASWGRTCSNLSKFIVKESFSHGCN